MDIYTSDAIRKEIENSKIDEDDLQFYGLQLMNLVMLYKQHIYIQDDDVQTMLDELERIAVAIVNRQYDDIITNSKEIIIPSTGHPIVDHMLPF